MSTSLYSTTNVEHMERQCLVRKMFGQVVDAKLIKGKLAISWKGLIQGNFFLDHYGMNSVMIEFMNEEDVDVVLEGRPWYVKGQIFHIEKWDPYHFSLGLGSEAGYPIS